MGVVVVAVSQDALQAVLPILETIWPLESVTYPDSWGDPCYVRFRVEDAPSESKTVYMAEIAKTTSGLTGLIAVTLRQATN